MGQVEATRRVATSSAVHRTGWPRNVVPARIFGIPATIVGAPLLGWLLTAGLLIVPPGVDGVID